MAKKLDLTIDPTTNKKREREKICKLLQMRNCAKVKDFGSQAEKVRGPLADKLRLEKERG